MSGSDLAHAFSASVGQFVGCATTFPIDVTKIKLMSTTTTMKIPWYQLLLQMLRQDGILGIYQRFPPKGFQQASNRFSYYYLYAWFSRLVTARTGSSLSVGSNLAIGYIVGVLNTIPSNPMDVVSTVVMHSTTRASVFDVMTNIYKTEGMFGFWKGAQLTFVTALNPAIQNTLFDQLKQWWLQRGGGGGGGGGGRTRFGRQRLYLTAFESFVLGAFAKAMATITTYPFSRAKVMTSTRATSTDEGMSAEASAKVSSIHAGTKKNVRKSMLYVLWEVFQTKGLAGLYQGIMPSLTKSVVQSAIMLLVKEKVDEYSRKFIVQLMGGE